MDGPGQQAQQLQLHRVKSVAVKNLILQFEPVASTEKIPTPKLAPPPPPTRQRSNSDRAHRTFSEPQIPSSVKKGVFFENENCVLHEGRIKVLEGEVQRLELEKKALLKTIEEQQEAMLQTIEVHEKEMKLLQEKLNPPTEKPLPSHRRSASSIERVDSSRIRDSKKIPSDKRPVNKRLKVDMSTERRRSAPYGEGSSEESSGSDTPSSPSLNGSSTSELQLPKEKRTRRARSLGANAAGTVQKQPSLKQDSKQKLERHHELKDSRAESRRESRQDIKREPKHDAKRDSRQDVQPTLELPQIMCSQIEPTLSKSERERDSVVLPTKKLSESEPVSVAVTPTHTQDQLKDNLTPNWILKYEDLVITEKIGKGVSSTVYRGTYKGKVVAVKVLHLAGEKDVKDFKEELAIMSQVSSAYLVRFYGASLEKKVTCVMELCVNGSLFHRLQDVQHTKVNWARVLDWGLQIAQGINVLHGWTPVILHRDLKTLNILLDSDWHIKVCDFGLSRFNTEASASQTLTKLRGTYSYTAPEMYYKKNYTTKSDVYSIGIMLWEMVTRVLTGKYVRPYSEFREIKMDYQIIFKVATKGLRPTIIENCPEEIVKTIQQCWATEPLERPSCPQLIEIMTAHLKLYKKKKSKWKKTEGKGISL